MVSTKDIIHDNHFTLKDLLLLYSQYWLTVF